MAREEQHDTRQQLLQLLLEKVTADTYPSATMLDLIEELLTPDDVQSYSEMLLEKIRNDNYPSFSLMDRLRALA